MKKKDSTISLNDQIFVAGANGMAGSAICRALSRSGFSNQLTPSRKDLDLTESHNVKGWFAKNQPTIVVLASAKVGGIHANSTQPTDFLLENLKIQNNVIEAAWIYGVRRLLFLGSSCIYPKLAKQPIKEEYLLTGALEPTNESYAIAKIAGIKLCASLRVQHGFDAISLMPTNLYGPGDNYHYMDSHVLPALIRRFHEAKENGNKFVTCWGTGKALREFLYVDDLGDACVFALKNWRPRLGSEENNINPLNILNVGNGIDLSIKELAEKIAETTGFKGEIRWDSAKPDGCPKKQLDISRMKSLGWQPKIKLKDGLKLAYKDFLDNLEKGKLRT